jgi:hypothetical protein
LIISLLALVAGLVLLVMDYSTYGGKPQDPQLRLGGSANPGGNQPGANQPGGNNPPVVNPQPGGVVPPPGGVVPPPPVP